MSQTILLLQKCGNWARNCMLQKPSPSSIVAISENRYQYVTGQGFFNPFTTIDDYSRHLNPAVIEIQPMLLVGAIHFEDRFCASR